MAEKELQSAYPTTNGHARSSDTEAAAAHDARELRKKKRTKCFLYILLFVIFQTAVITLFALTVMKVKTPKFRVRSATFTNFIPRTGATSSLQATMSPQFSVKNTNFGRYKYRETTVEFFYRGTSIGQALIPNSKAGWRSTKRFIVPAVNLNIVSSAQLDNDLRAEVVPITSSARMTGRVELMFIMKKNKATNMNCTMEIVTTTQSLRNIVCK